MSINNLGCSCLHLCGPLLVRGPKFEKKRLRKLALPRPVYLLVLDLDRDVNKDLTPKDQDKDLTPKDKDLLDLTPKDKDLTPKDKDLKYVLKAVSIRNGKFYETERQSKILEHSADKLLFSSYNQSRRNGTMMHMHLTNRNGVPVHFES